MKLFSMEYASNNRNKQLKHRASIIILTCFVVMFGAALTFILVKAALLTNNDEINADSPSEEINETTIQQATYGYSALLPDNDEVSVFSKVPISEMQGEQSPEGINFGEFGRDAIQEDTSDGYVKEAQETVISNVDDMGGQNAAGPDNGNSLETSDNAYGALGIVGGKLGKHIRPDDSLLFEYAGGVDYCVYYPESGDYATSGSSSKTPSASVIKVFIMEYAFSQNNELDLEEMLNGVTLLSLITRMIQVSDNNATNILIDRFGMDNLNTYFVEQGYTDTVLERKMLDYTSRSAGFDNYTSATDCLAFLYKLYDGQDGDPYKQMLEIMRGQQIRTKIPMKLPADIVVANKTGELDDIENDIGIVFAKESPFVIVILTRDVISTMGIRNAIADFALATFMYGEIQSTE